MEYMHIWPSIEVLIFNLIVLDHCFKRKYSILKEAAVFCAFTAFFVLPLVFFKRDVFDGSGRLSILGFIYIIPLKFLYDEKTERLFLNMCMSWTYTLGIMAISIQTAYFLGFLDYDLSLLIIETVLFSVTFFPFRKYVIPKYCYIFQNMHDFPKAQFRYLELSAYSNFFVLSMLHIFFLNSETHLLQILVLAIFLMANYLLYTIVYEIIKSSKRISELEKTAMHDALTGLGNRVQMMRHMRILIEENHTFSIMFLDLDGFKLINDQYGHDVGDRYLIHFGNVCSDELKDQGKLYRYGGDEFVAIYYGVLTEEKINAICKCRKWDEDAPCGFNQVSAGMIVCKPPYSVKDPDAILKRADSIMYRNKLNRRMKNPEKHEKSV